MRCWRTVLLVLCAASSQIANTRSSAGQESVWTQGSFEWRVGEPLVQVESARLPPSEDPWIAIKDPSIVRFEKQWHLFCTLRKQKQGDGRIRIGYCRFGDWADAATARWHVLDLTLGYHGAPQVFYFEPQKQWYLIYQAEDSSRGLKYGPCYSTTKNIEDPESWSKPEPLYVVQDGEKAGLDFWVICDEEHAHLFFTSLNGSMWHSRTTLDKFPNQGWTER